MPSDRPSVLQNAVVRVFLLAGWCAAFIVHIVAPSEWRWLTPDEQKVVAAAVGVSGGGILNLGDRSGRPRDTLTTPGG